MLTTLPQESKEEEYLDYKWMNNLTYFIELLLLKYFKASFHVLSYPEIQVGLFKDLLAQKELQLKDQMILLRLSLLDSDWRFCEQQEKLTQTLVAQLPEGLREDHQLVMKTLEGWKWLFNFQESNVVSRRIYLSKASKCFQQQRVSQQPFSLNADWQLIGQLGSILAKSNELFGSLESSLEYLRELKGEDEGSLSNQMLRVLENMLLMEQGAQEQQYSGMMGLMALVRDTDESVLMVVTLAVRYFKRQGFKDRSSHAQLIQIANAKSDVYNDLELEMLKTYTLKYAYQMQPFDLVEFFKDYPEEERLYPLYQFYQYYYILSFLMKQSSLEAKLQPLLFKYTQLINNHLPYLKSPKALLKTLSLLTKIYRHYQLDRLALSQIDTYVLSDQSLLV